MFNLMFNNYYLYACTPITICILQETFLTEIYIFKKLFSSMYGQQKRVFPQPIRLWICHSSSYISSASVHPASSNIPFDRFTIIGLFHHVTKIFGLVNFELVVKAQVLCSVKWNSGKYLYAWITRIQNSGYLGKVRKFQQPHANVFCVM